MSLIHRVRRYLSRPYAIPADVHASRFVQLLIQASFRRLKVALGAYDPLTRLADKHRTDKGVTLYPFMAYSVHYDKLFSRYRDKEVRILEIGLGPQGLSTCPSLKTWADYFPKATIYGFDIQDFSHVQLPRTHIFQGDQGKPEDLLKIVQNCPEFDIIIDDGSHASFHQQITLKTLFPYLADDGYFIIEDLIGIPQDLEAELPTDQTTRELLKDPTALNELVSGVDNVWFPEPFIEPRMREGFALLTKRAR